MELEQKLSAVSALRSSSDPNGCGGADSVFNGGILDFPFKNACNAHDSCYANGTSRSICDAAFLQDMKLIAADYVENELGSNSIANAIVEKLLNAQANVYHKLVKNLGNEFYCAVESNATNPECVYDENDIQSNGLAEALGSSTEIYSSSGSSFAFYSTTCDIWRLPDGNGGHYYLHMNCTVVSMAP